MTRPSDDREVPGDRRQRRDRELVVAVQDPDDDPGDAEQGDDREEHAREADGEPCRRVAERRAYQRREQDEQRGDAPRPSSISQKQARGDAPGAGALALLEQVAEDRDEGATESAASATSARIVFGTGRRLERVDRPADAEVVARDDLAEEPENAREAGREREDRRRPGEPPPRPGPARFHAGEYKEGACRRRSRGCRSRRLRQPGKDAERTRLAERSRSGADRSSSPPRAYRAAGGGASVRALLRSPARWSGHFHAMANIKQQKKRVRTAAAAAAREPPLPLDDQDADASGSGRGRGRRRRPRRRGAQAAPAVIDRAAARGAIHRNLAARKKAQAARLATSSAAS